MATTAPAVSDASDSTDKFAAIHDPTTREAESADIFAEMLGEEATPDTVAERSSDATGETTTAPATITDGSEIPTDGAKPAEPDADALLAKAEPFSYTLNGETKTLDGIKVIPGEGAIVDEAYLPQLKDLIQHGQKAWNDNRALYQDNQRYQSLEFKDGTGNTHKGMEAFAASLTENARLVACVRLLAEAIENPERITALATDPAEIQRLQRELGLAAKEAQFTAREQWGQRTAQFTQESNAAGEAQSLISNAAQQWARQFPDLDAKDVEQAVAYLNRVGGSIVRQATPEEAREANVRPGERIIDHRIVYDYLKERAESKTARVAAAKQADKAARENAQRTAAAKKPVAPKPVAKPATGQPEHKETDRERKDREWREQKNRMMANAAGRPMAHADDT